MSQAQSSWIISSALSWLRRDDHLGNLERYSEKQAMANIIRLEMEHPIDSPFCLFSGGLIITIAMNEFEGRTFQPLRIAGFSKETADLDSFSNKRFCQMASDKSFASGDQTFQ
jgi:hypothetical protein